MPFVSVIVMKDLLDTDIVNLNDLSKAIQSLNLSHQVIHFENMTFAEQISSLRSQECWFQCMKPD